MKKNLEELGLNLENSIVIGSGILQALDVRKSKDIDLVVTKEVFNSLKNSGKFTVSKNHSREILENNIIEIGTDWVVLGESYEFEDFKDASIVIDEVRYITLDFLYKAKKSWVDEGSARPKDIEDIKLMEEYLKRYKN